MKLKFSVLYRKHIGSVLKYMISTRYQDGGNLCLRFPPFEISPIFHTSGIRNQDVKFNKNAPECREWNKKQTKLRIQKPNRWTCGLNFMQSQFGWEKMGKIVFELMFEARKTGGKSIKTLFHRIIEKLPLNIFPFFIPCRCRSFDIVVCINIEWSARERSPNWFIAIASQEYQLRMFPECRKQTLLLAMA